MWRLDRGGGTRVKLYPQPPYLGYFTEPETIELAVPAGAVRAGPADDRLYTVQPAATKTPYQYPFLPPYRGPRLPAVRPDRAGHFDYLDPSDQGFTAVHMYGAVRRVLDIWDRYTGQTIGWFFRPALARLELIPAVEWDNAQSGFGFIEAGFRYSARGQRRLHCLNFDVLAHETGHNILFGLMGVPPETDRASEYLGFHEAFCDLIALISVLHFDSVVSHLLTVSNGNLYTLNELNRIGELSRTEQIRLASNAKKMSDVGDSAAPHDMSEPLTGAVFDILVAVYQDQLLRRGRISAAMAKTTYSVPLRELDDPALTASFAAAYAEAPAAFRRALIRARDYTGLIMAHVARRLDPAALTYSLVGRALIEADRAVSGGTYRAIIGDSLRWRGIDPAWSSQHPALATSPARIHSYASRMAAARQGLG